MKVNKTLSLDYSIVQELKSMNNQSAFVNAAILKRLSGIQGVDPDVGTRVFASRRREVRSEYFSQICTLKHHFTCK